MAAAAACSAVLELFHCSVLVLDGGTLVVEEVVVVFWVVAWAKEALEVGYESCDPFRFLDGNRLGQILLLARGRLVWVEVVTLVAAVEGGIVVHVGCGVRPVEEEPGGSLLTLVTVGSATSVVDDEAGPSERGGGTERPKCVVEVVVVVEVG